MRLRFQFSLRFLLLCAAVIAFGAAIFANRGHRQRQAIETVERLGGTCIFASQSIDEGYRGPDLRVIPRNDLWVPLWIRHLIGEEYFSGLIVVSLHDTAATDSDLTVLMALIHLQVLDIENTAVTEHGLKEFRERLPLVQIIE